MKKGKNKFSQKKVSHSKNKVYNKEFDKSKVKCYNYDKGVQRKGKGLRNISFFYRYRILNYSEELIQRKI